jgi:mono/diheme cytochrome c family protein
MVMRTLGNLLRFCALAGWMVGVCSGQEKPPPKVPDASSSLSSGEELFKQHCVACHGNDMKGNGPFPPPYRVPPDLSTLSRRHGGKFPEVYVSSVLRNGVKMPAHGPAEMPVWGAEFEAANRADKSEVESRIRNLTNYIKSRQAK